MKRIIIDAEKCVGCKNCTIACIRAHQTSADVTVYNVDMENIANEARHAIKLNWKQSFKPVFCMHCDAPECVLACMSGAMTKDEESGRVMYNADRCAGCFMCVMSCPYGVPRPDKNTKTVVIKCDLCYHDEEGPNCVRSCPTKAITLVEV